MLPLTKLTPWAAWFTTMVAIDGVEGSQIVLCLFLMWVSSVEGEVVLVMLYFLCQCWVVRCWHVQSAATITLTPCTFQACIHILQTSSMLSHQLGLAWPTWWKALLSKPLRLLTKIQCPYPGWNHQLSVCHELDFLVAEGTALQEVCCLHQKKGIQLQVIGLSWYDPSCDWRGLTAVSNRRKEHCTMNIATNLKSFDR